MDASAPSLWIVSDGKAGHETLALGVAETLGLQPDVRRIRTDGLWAGLAPYGPPAPGSVGGGDAQFGPPWPSMVIAVGRCTMPYAAAIKRKARDETFVMALQNPVISPKNFDLVWAPEHDRLEGPNVISTITGPHRLSSKAIAAAAKDYAPQLKDLPQKKVAVLVGGPTRAFRFAEMEARLLCSQLDQLGPDIGFLITTSRRTPKEVTDVLSVWAKMRPCRFWTGEGPNPYLGYLGVSDAIVVTCDSVNMLGEAVSTGKPVYVFSPPARDEHKAEKFFRLQDAIAATGATRRLVGKLESWSYPPLDANRQIATAVRTRLSERGVKLPSY
ncbi:MAG: mitochondrial fission ELM1 family protein [Caulobacterales bacterium]